MELIVVQFQCVVQFQFFIVVVPCRVDSLDYFYCRVILD